MRTPRVDPGDESLLTLIDKLAGLLERTELNELEVQVGSTGLVLRKPSALASMAQVAVAAGGGPVAAPVDGMTASPAAGTATDGAAAPTRPAVMAPLSGIWYGSPAPGSAPYVTVGGEVAVGQVIGLIEAMKLFNEMKSEHSGTIRAVLVGNAEPVEYGQPLFELEPA